VATAKSKTVPVKPGFPDAIKSSGDDMAGYYLNNEGYKDIAVLQVASFEGSAGSNDFQAMARDFLKQARADGKKKLVIDLQANAGGTIWVSTSSPAKPFGPKMYGF
jgi:C-terminal processing protease CtpA/Prc